MNQPFLPNGISIGSVVFAAHSLNFTKFFVRATFGSGSVFLCQQNDTLLLARLMGQYCLAGWRLSSSVVCRRL